MAGIFGHLNINDTERAFNVVQGQNLLWDAAQEYLARVSAEVDAVESIFIEKVTSDFKERYKLPGGGFLQRRNSDGSFGNVKAVGSWDVAYPLEDFGAAYGWNDVEIAYMTVRELSNHIETVSIQDVNTRRFELLKALLNNTQDTFLDQTGRGSLSIEPLANGDAVVYPPVLGSSTEATEDHYLESGYLAANISDVNNPFPVIVDELEHHFGAPQGGSNIISWVSSTHRTVIEALTDFIEADQKDVIPGTDVDRVTNLPSPLPGRVFGKVSGVWVAEWRSLPANYIVSVHADNPKPLVKRVDPADTGLPQGLTLITEDEVFPFKESYVRHRFGLGAGNRLNGVVMELGVGGTYSIPSGYS